MDLQDAITAVEQSDAAYRSATNTVENDQTAAAAIQAKLDAANTQTAVDQTAQTAAVVARNSALDAAIAVFTAAKIPV